MANCDFVPKGLNIQECIDACNNETEDLCSEHCMISCKNCTNEAECKWLQSTTSSTPTIKSSTCFNNMSVKIMEYSKIADRILNNNNHSDSLKNLDLIKDDNKKKEIIWMYLTNMYMISTDLIKHNYTNIKLDKKNIIVKKNLINKNKKLIEKLKEIVETKNRQYKINMGKYRKMLYETKLLQYLFFYIVILLVIPLLYLFGILNKLISVLSWITLVFIGLVVTIYKFSNRNNRDNLFYNQLQFEKPSHKNLVKNKYRNQLSEDNNDLDFDPSTIDIGDISKWKS